MEATDRFNAALESATVGVAVRHMAGRKHCAQPSAFIEGVANDPCFPELRVRNVIAAAQRANWPLRGVAASIEELRELQLPVLAYLRRSSSPVSPLDLVQIESLGRRSTTLSSDRFGSTRITNLELKERWTDIILIPTPGDGSREQNIDELDEYRGEIRVIPGLLSPDECARLIALCERSSFQRSRVAQRRGDERSDLVAPRIRSSSSVVLRETGDPVLGKLRLECARRERVHPSFVETIQCVRYKPGQRFRAHYDGGRNLPRLTTYLVYLNDGFDGGETYFPLLDYSVVPVAGNCLRFPSCDRFGRVLWPSQHGGLPVSRGVKYALNIWIRCPGVDAPNP